jgi:hypothetical protein
MNRESSSYHNELSKYRTAQSRGSSYHRQSQREKSYDDKAKPVAYIDHSGKQVIDYQNRRCSENYEKDESIEQEPDIQDITEPPATKMPDFGDLATILQTVNNQSARKQQIRAQGMTQLLKTLYSKSAASSSTGATEQGVKLNVFDQMQSTIHKILREEKSTDDEPVKGGSIRSAIIKITEKLYKEDFAEVRPCQFYC